MNNNTNYNEFESQVKIEGSSAEVEITKTLNWEEVPSENRDEYTGEAKTKKQWEKIDKKELDRDTKKEKEEHEKDAVILYTN